MLDTSLSCTGLPAVGASPGGDFVPSYPPEILFTGLVAEGDSLTDTSITPGGSYADRIAAARSGMAFANYAVGGSFVSTMLARLEGMMAAEDPSHLTVMIGTNDLQPPNTPVDLLADVLGYVAAAKAIKPTLIVGVAGIPPKATAANGAAFNPMRCEYNALLRAQVGSGIDFYIPLGDHPAFANAAGDNPGIMGDGSIRPLRDRTFWPKSMAP
ncbi:MAG TPA: SGNH/GDSL hydrolase family protein [Croceibacterium sp.]|nr:SGNH/GDSL hydrolase family protein [Croceibacterium sp.]